jgi:peptidyl-dipeptidase A
MNTKLTVRLSNLTIILLASLIAVSISGCRNKAKEKELQTFINQHVEKIKPLEKEFNLASWRANNSGKSEDYAKASELELQIRKIYSNSEEFNFLKAMKESKKIKERLLARQLDKLYNSYLENQIDPELMKQMVTLSSKIEEQFNTYRSTIDGRKYSDSEIKDILKQETDSVKRQKAWEASKQVGPVVSANLIKLVKMRNEAAKKVGFDNYHTMSLALGEQDVKELDQIFGQLYELTQEPFKKVKNELDATLAAKYNVAPADLMPWHYHDPFFQETPLVYNVDLDVYYDTKNVKQLAAKFYDGIGLPVDSILAKSDLYEREGKMPHAFCTNIDREGDIRILCNLKNNEQWMEAILHELGHSVYDKNIDQSTPYLLREPAHTFTTEAIAMLFGRCSQNAYWIRDVFNLSNQQCDEIKGTTQKYSQLKQLIFARWVMVMYNFEKQLYANPDQDLNKLWWDLAEKYQMLKRPAGRNSPDWAAKIHFTIAPCYYHNYALGEMLASQLNNKIAGNILKGDDKSYVGQKQIGEFLKTNVFQPAAIYQWNEMIKRATGEPLNPKYFVQQYVQ